MMAELMAFYEKPVTKFGMKAWWNALKTDDIGDIEAAIGRHMADPDAGKFAPKPAHIVEILNAQDSPRWCLDAGFRNRYDAESSRCHKHNAHLFRDGGRLDGREPWEPFAANVAVLAVAHSR